MYDVIVAIREAFKSNDSLVALLTDKPSQPNTIRAYAGHILTVENPVYPCVTINRIAGGVASNYFSNDLSIQIDVWSKNGYDELYQIYNIIRSIINVNHSGQSEVSYNGTEVAKLKEVHVNDNLFEEDTRTWHLASKYNVIAVTP